MNEEMFNQEMNEVDEHLLEIENRIKNLFWTVSGDYEMDVKPDVETFAQSKHISLYDVIKQGAFAKYYNTEELALYVLKKKYRMAQEKPLMELVQLCVDMAVYPRLVLERKGIQEIRIAAFEDILKLEQRDNETFFEKVKHVMMRRFLRQSEVSEIDSNNSREIHIVDRADNQIMKAVLEIESLQNALDTDSIIIAIDKIYNTFFDFEFEEKYGNLESVLNVPILQLATDAQKECMSDEQMDAILKKYLSDMKKEMLRLKKKKDAKDDYVPDISSDCRDQKQKKKDPQAVKKVYEYVKLNYGDTCLNGLERSRVQQKYCKGIHAGCSLHYTDGILHQPVIKNNQYRFSQLQYEKNRLYYGNNHRIIKQNTMILADTLQKALTQRADETGRRSQYGELAAARLWKIGRTTDEKLFELKTPAKSREFVIDILLDSSGSQAKRQPQIATQGYIISEALSMVNIPHRVISYCTFWDYTVLHRFRDYEDKKENNLRIFEFRATGSNRDGLAIKAVSSSLQQRSEENKILIVLSDGKPSDVTVERPGTGNPAVYYGEAAIKDTGFEVRRIRNQGTAVLGIFTGNEKDLEAEKNIYGKDFAYIRNISNFSKIVGAYLRRQIDSE